MKSFLITMLVIVMSGVDLYAADVVLKKDIVISVENSKSTHALPSIMVAAKIGDVPMLLNAIKKWRKR